MTVLHQVLLVLHVLSSMVWFGAGLTIGRRLREAIALGRPAANHGYRDVRRLLRSMFGGAIATVATGLGLVFAVGGFGVVPPRIHAGLGLAVVAILILLAGARPLWRKAGAIIESGEELAGAIAPARRAAAVHGATHLLFVVVLVLMLWES